jgi:hypothetical protein
MMMIDFLISISDDAISTTISDADGFVMILFLDDLMMTYADGRDDFLTDDAILLTMDDLMTRRFF